MPELLRSAKLAIEKGLAQGRNDSYIKQLSDYIVPALVEALHKVVVVCVIEFVILIRSESSECMVSSNLSYFSKNKYEQNK